MQGVNRVTILGACGADPEIRTTSSGDRVANLRMATDEGYRDRATGEWKSSTQWHRLTCWIPAVVNYLDLNVKKGMTLYVEGSLKTRRWTDNQGVERYSTEIEVGTLINVTKQPATQEEPAAESKPPTRARSRRQEPQRETFSADLDDEIPF